MSDVRLKIRAGLDAGNWRGQGERLLRGCAEHDTRILLVIDELPIFLKRMLRTHDGADRVERFLSWLRGVFQSLGGDSPVLIVSGSIGLTPLVHRLGIPDRINYLEPFRLGPWNREASVACFDRLANSAALAVEDGVAGAVYDALGIGIPHHVQSFFARLRDYETRLRDALDEESRSIAMEILADAATQGVLTAGARIRLGELYSRVVDDAHARITEILDVLIHDGYLEVHGGDHRFPSRLLRDWWAARFRDHHVPITSRSPDAPEGRVQ